MWLAFIFLFGFAACYPYGLPNEASNEDILAFVADMEEAMDMPYAVKYDDEPQTELGKRLREKLDELLEQAKDAIEKGKVIKQDLKEKINEIREKLRDAKEDIGNKARELLEKLKERVKEQLKKLLEKLGLKDASEEEFSYAEFEEDEPQTELGKKLREKLDELLEKAKDAIEKGKVIGEDLKRQIKEAREKLKDLKEDIGNKAKEIIEKLKEKAKEHLKKLLEKLGLKDASEEEFAYAEFDEKDPKTKLVKKLRKHLDHVLEQIKYEAEIGKAIRQDLMKMAQELVKKLKDLKVDVGNKAREIMENFTKHRAKDFKLERLGIGDITTEEFAYAEFDEEEDPKTELGKKLRDHLDHILEQIKDGIDKGKAIKQDLVEKAKELRKRLQELKIDVGSKARELYEKIKENAKDFFKKLLERLGIGDMSDEFADTEFDEEEANDLKRKFDEILDKIKDAIEKGKSIHGDLLEQAREIRRKLKDMKIDISEKAKEVWEKIKEKIRNWWKEIFGKKEFSDDDYSDIDLDAVLRGILSKIDSQDSTEDIADYIKEKLRDAPLGEALLQTLRQGRTPLRQVVKTLLGIRDNRSISDLYEKIKDYVKGLKQKYQHFLDWVKDVFSKGKEAAKDRIDNVKDVAREFINDARKVSKQVAEEALEFFRPYKEDLGQLWEDIKKRAKEAIGH